MAYTIQKGGNIMLMVDATAIECLTSCDLNSSAEEIDTTCKNPDNNKSYEVGAFTTDISFAANYTDGTGSNEDFHTLWVSHRAGTQVTMLWGGVDTGDTTYSMTGYIFGLQATAGNSGELVGYTGNFKANSAVTVATVA